MVDIRKDAHDLSTNQRLRKILSEKPTYVLPDFSTLSAAKPRKKQQKEANTQQIVRNNNNELDIAALFMTDG